MTVRPGCRSDASAAVASTRLDGQRWSQPAKKGSLLSAHRCTTSPAGCHHFPPHPGVDQASKTLSAFLHIAPLCPFLSLRVVKQSLFDLHGCGPPPSSTMTMTIYFLLVPIATVDPDPKIVLDPTNFLRPTTRVFVRFGGCPQSSWVQGRRLL